MISHTTSWFELSLYFYFTYSTTIISAYVGEGEISRRVRARARLCSRHWSRCMIDYIYEDLKKGGGLASGDTKNNKSKAAKLLNIDRKTLYSKIERYGLDS